jgi:hypothetical protein
MRVFETERCANDSLTRTSKAFSPRPRKWLLGKGGGSVQSIVEALQNEGGPFGVGMPRGSVDGAPNNVSSVCRGWRCGEMSQ